MTGQVQRPVAGVRVARARRLRRRIWGLVSGAGCLCLVALVSLTLGSRSIPLGETVHALTAYDAGNDLHLVIWALRIPRTLVAILAGLSLGLAGAVMQAVTRNPLAEPGLLGINAGAALAVVGGVSLFGLTTPAQYVGFAALGAGLAGAAVFVLGRAHEAGTSPVRLVLAGAGLSVVLGALTAILIINGPSAVLDDFRHWAAGSVEGRGYDTAAILALSTVIGGGMALSMAGSLNAIALGQDLGRVLGTHVRGTWTLACLSVMVLVGAATAGAGPIAFVGLVASHLARLAAGPDYRWILPYAGLFAAILLLGSDIVGRVIASPSEVAAGIIAALVGGPFFLVVVCRFRLRAL